MWKIGSSTQKIQNKTFHTIQQRESMKMETPKSSLSKEIDHSISHKPNLLLSILVVGFCFAFIPLIPIVIAFLWGHWFSSQNKNKRG